MNCHGGDKLDRRLRSKDLQARGPRTEHALSSRMSQIFATTTREEQAPKHKHLCFPRNMLTCSSRKRRQRRPTGRKQQRDRRPGSQEHGGPDRSKTFSQGQSPQKWRTLGAKLPTRSQEKQSPVVEAAEDRIRHKKEKRARIVACSLRLFTNRRTQIERGRSRERKKQKTGAPSRQAQVPGGRLGGQDQEGSSTRRSFLCSDSTLLPPASVLGVPPCASIIAIDGLPLEGWRS